MFYTEGQLWIRKQSEGKRYHHKDGTHEDPEWECSQGWEQQISTAHDHEKETSGILSTVLYQVSDGEGAVLIIGRMEEKELGSRGMTR